MNTEAGSPGVGDVKAGEQERFLYLVSHDLKGPLHTILGFADVMRKDLESGVTGNLDSDLHRIEEAAREMQARLDAMLVLSRLASKSRPLAACDLGDLAKEAIERLKPIVVARCADISVQQGMPVWEVDRAAVVDLFFNLLDNALKYARPGSAPVVQVGFVTLNGKQVIQVQDEGLGLEARNLERIFEPFRKLDASTAGCGAGLTIARGIVELHGGRIWAESAGLGTGSVFRFVLSSWGP